MMTPAEEVKRMDQEFDRIKKKKTSIEIEVDTKELDAAIEKANHLTELLKEAQQIIDSLCDQEKSET